MSTKKSIALAANFGQLMASLHKDSTDSDLTSRNSSSKSLDSPIMLVDVEGPPNSFATRSIISFLSSVWSKNLELTKSILPFMQKFNSKNHKNKILQAEN
ncbi:hypothetical protein BpHYR1_010744 [Brachionus plicatilis]|uniref:Uncharacterized protein n=1 Tax=Brachionus plicatilis TaxID=10195 RepID=A0A3M7P2S6_BRAPC|nr:hypothetical protein BpHYR1_010744 [Brachionus plicatilis]